MRRQCAAARAAFLRAQKAFEWDQRAARAQRRRQDPNLAKRYFATDELYQKLNSKLSFAEAELANQASMTKGASINSSGGRPPPRQPKPVQGVTLKGS